MIGAVHLGLLAACIVLFVPMGMAGWHLSRNKMLFFSCALFITLAVGVHLMPYLSLISSSLSPSQEVISLSSPISSHPDSCLFSLHNIMYSDDTTHCIDNDCNKKSWDWIKSKKSDASECEFHKLNKSDASDLLNGSWVVVAGDSQARLVAVSLLDLLMGSENVERIRADLFKRHSDYSMTVEEIGMKLDFIWAPYVKNLTELISTMKINKNNNSLPDVIVMGAGLWDMLHVNNASEYSVSLRVLRDNVLSLLPVSSKYLDSSESTRLLHLFWVGLPTLTTSMLNTDAKRERMTGLMCDLYDDEVKRSRILRQSGGVGGPLLNLDIRSLSEMCGSECSVDGMHYDGVVYDAAVQIMLNALLVESDQKP